MVSKSSYYYGYCNKPEKMSYQNDKPFIPSFFISEKQCKIYTNDGPKAGLPCMFPFHFERLNKTCPGPECCNLDNDPNGIYFFIRINFRAY